MAVAGLAKAPRSSPCAGVPAAQIFWAQTSHNAKPWPGTSCQGGYHTAPLYVRCMSPAPGHWTKPAVMLKQALSRIKLLSHQ
jgi:hypothetical protein